MKRMSSLFLILCACFVSVALGQEPAGKVLANWSEFLRGNMERWNNYEKVLGVNNVGNLKLKWAYSIDNSYGFSSPIVTNGILYADGPASFLYALNANTGKEIWKEPDVLLGMDTTAVSNGVVYSSGQQGTLTAFNAGTGALLWTSSVFPFTAPTIANGIIYTANDGRNTLYAVSTSNGAVLWSYTASDKGEGYWSSVAVVNGIVYADACCGTSQCQLGTVYALNAGTGDVLWTYCPTGTDFSSPAVANGVVYVGGGYTMYALNAATGAMIWEYSSSDYLYSSPAVANGIVYIGCNYSLCALNASTGALGQAPQQSSLQTLSKAAEPGPLHVAAVFLVGLRAHLVRMVRIVAAPTIPRSVPGSEERWAT